MEEAFLDFKIRLSLSDALGFVPCLVNTVFRVVTMSIVMSCDSDVVFFCIEIFCLGLGLGVGGESKQSYHHDKGDGCSFHRMAFLLDCVSLILI